MTKTCNLCGQSRPLDEYHVNRGHADGLQGMCKICIRAYKRGYKAGLRRLRRFVA